jgi:hypothetical protein
MEHAPVHPLLPARLLLAETHPAIAEVKKCLQFQMHCSLYATTYYIDEHE